MYTNIEIESIYIKRMGEEYKMNTEQLKFEYDLYLFDFLFVDIDSITDYRAITFEEFCKTKLKMGNK